MNDARPPVTTAAIREAASFWDREVITPTHVSWMQDPLVREYINTRIGGRDEPRWPFDWFQSVLGSRRFTHGLSIGCGSGALERDVVRRGLCARVEAFDGSVQSIAIARQLAADEGLDRSIGYFVADFNAAALPRKKFDIIFFHQSLHHVEELERLLEAVHCALAPGGILYLDEYVGPSASQWNDELMAAAREVFGVLPAEMRKSDTLPFPIQQDDPSEAIRSGEIIEQVSIGFDTVHDRGYGGNLLAVVYPLLARRDDAVIEALIRAEEELLAAARSYYAVMVLRRKPGIRGWLARLRYRFEPKWRAFISKHRSDAMNDAPPETQ
jgi:SAM-dependent methyltransferase